MTTRWLPVWYVGVALACGSLVTVETVEAALTTNSWSNSGDGLWHVGLNWSLSVTPSNNQAAVLITNAATKSVVVNNLSAALSSVMTISNLTVSGFGAGTNTLLLSNAGTTTPLRILNGFALGTNAVLTVTNSALNVEGLSGGGFSIDGVVTFQHSSVEATNVTVTIGNIHRGSLTMNEGSMTNGTVILGATVGSSGTLTLAAGTNVISSQFLVGNPGTGTVWMTGGQLAVTNSITAIGNSGIGQLTFSNGTVLTTDMNVGGGKSGTLTMAGGNWTLLVGNPKISIGGFVTATGTVWMTGGQLVVTGLTQAINIADGGVGLMSVSNDATVLTHDLGVGTVLGGRGTLTIAGGTNSVFNRLTIGLAGCTATGAVVIAGGRLFVTNSTTSAALEVRAGTLTLNSGVLVVDKFVLTNACAHFVRTGGTLILNSIPVLDPTRDDDGDGIPNGYELSHGFDPLDPADGALDSDGDGLTNLQEFQTRTDPFNSASALRILNLVRQDPDMRITWTGGGGTNYAVQAADGGAGGSFTNDFFTLATIFLSGVGDKTNTYIDAFGATNSPAHYYRIRLVP